MKQKLKKMYSLIAICTIFAFSSCQDDFNENVVPKKDGVIMENFSLTNSKKEKPNFKLLKAIDNLKAKTLNEKTNNKIVYDSIYDFYYDDENGIYIENNGKNSYTFPITRTNGDDKVEDIVFNLNEDNEYDIVLIKYNLTNQEALSLTKDEILDTDIEITDIQTKFAVSCGMYIVMCDNNGSGGTGHLHVAGSGCHSPSHLSVQWVNSTCFDNGGDSGLGSGEILTIPHGGGGGYDDLTPPNPCEKVKKLFTKIPSARSELTFLDTKTADASEWGRYKLSTANIVQTPPTLGSGEVSFPKPATGMYTMMAHTHNDPASSTYSIFSWTDLAAMASLIRQGKLDTENFVAFLMTADGTRYAFTIEDPEAFSQFFAIKLDADYDSAIGNKMATAMNRYYDPANTGNPIIKENSTDNVADEKAFLDFMSDNNIGASLFETNSTFTTFNNVTHNKTTGNVDKQPCN